MEPAHADPALPPSPSPATGPGQPLLEKPVNRGTRRIYVAATRMNDGKTTACLGLFAALQSIHPRVGFIKPVGQRFIEVGGHQVDEDSFLLDTIYHVHVPIESMSPITVDPTFTRRYLKNPGELHAGLVDRVCRAFDRVSWEKDLTLIEGTGHAGVGAVFGLSNARVARILDAHVIIVAQGGVGRPVDEIALNKALFDREGVKIAGAILNKVEPDKMEMVAEYAGIGLRGLGVPLLGILPQQKMLSAPNLSQVAEEIRGRWINARSTGGAGRVHRIVMGDTSAKGIIDALQPGVLLITPGDRDDIILAAIANSGGGGRPMLSGIVLTNNFLPHPRLTELLAGTGIPVIAASQDSYTIASRINSMTVKTQPQDTDKIPVIKQLIMEHVDLDAITRALSEED